ncbi:MAG: hypothetical protein CVV64_02155 [Candidatus Wallbacteria bacterium HGW-Wallbacteria-1]|jgi:hypothetical protein|uniref:Uncharacterized protein n=1 Tax=Candidatus Wallbacteria bacterium HGW-Wallbacteria-1 TaxID=2013854 RepID=A0A2N1PV64_9BACT|nr:MAG: hypothetical protein CVV64_02155 [Candidatus Wallbacteria bacterium HGW-Wallbacteria-1]
MSESSQDREVQSVSEATLEAVGASTSELTVSSTSGSFAGFIVPPFVWMILFYIAVIWISPWSQDHFGLTGAPVSGIALFTAAGFMSLTALWAIGRMAGTNVSGAVLVLVFAISALADIGINRSLANGAAGGMHHYGFINLSLMGMAYSGGTLVSRAVDKVTYILPLSVIAGIADIWSVFAGVTKEVAKSKVALNYALFSYPVPGFGIRPLVGATDFLFAALYLSLALKFDLPFRRNAILVGFSFLLSIAIAIGTGLGIPVLPVMALMVILGNWSSVKVTDPREKREALAGIVMVVTALAIITLVRR